MNAFIYNDNGNNLIVEDGKVTVSYITDAWREGLRYMNRLCKEKLLDPISFTQDNSQLRAMVDNPDDCIVGCFSFMSITLLPVATSPYQDYYDALMPLKGPDGVQLTTFNPTVPTNRWFITGLFEPVFISEEIHSLMKKHFCVAVLELKVYTGPGQQKMTFLFMMGLNQCMYKM